MKIRLMFAKSGDRLNLVARLSLKRWIFPVLLFRSTYSLIQFYNIIPVAGKVIIGFESASIALTIKVRNSSLPCIVE
jgi:hypothetical protein